MAFKELVRTFRWAKKSSTNGKQIAEDPLSIQAHHSGDIFKEAEYFSIAENDIDGQWQNIVWPMIQNFDFSTVVDLAAGHGRNTTKLLTVAHKIIVVDINQECIDFCKNRFGHNRKISYLQNDGYSLKGIRDNSVSLLYSFDSMVHFDSEVIQNYLKQIYRVLKPGGRGFIHHSN